MTSPSAAAADRVSQIVGHLATVTPSLKDKVCIVTGAGSVHGIGYENIYCTGSTK